VRALVGTEEDKQIELARRLDKKIAEQFIKKTSDVAGRPIIIIIIIEIVHGVHI